MSDHKKMIASGKVKGAPKESESGIKLFFHCKKCIAELPQGMSPREWTSMEIGVMPGGTVRVWCKRHETLIVDL